MKTIIELLENTFKTMFMLSVLVGMVLFGLASVLLLAAGWAIHWSLSVLGLFFISLWLCIIDILDENVDKLC